jgi:superoxide reductase
MEFYICKHCGNIITFAENKGVPVVCCGEKMHKLEPGSVDAAVEKHVPVYTVEGNTVTVTVGSVTHPMTTEHLIDWIALETEQGTQIKHLTADSAPSVTFALADGDKVKKVYAYCNLHGLWVAE